MNSRPHGPRTKFPNLRSIGAISRSLLCLLLTGLTLGVTDVEGQPVHVRTVLKPPPTGSTPHVRVESKGVGAFETIEIVSRWDSAGYKVFADFASLDDGGLEPAVIDSGNGSYLFQHTTGDITEFIDGSSVIIPIIAIGSRDTTTWRTFAVCRNTSGMPRHIETHIVDEKRVYRPGDTIVVESRWRPAGYIPVSIEADYRSLAPRFQHDPGGVTTTRDHRDYVFTITYQIPGTGLVEEQNSIPLSVIATDPLCSRIRYDGMRIDLRTGSAPAPIAHTLVSPADRGVREGDALEVVSTWDATGYEVRADFTGLDNGTGGSASVLDADSGRYVVRYNVGSLAGLRDQTVRIPITAVNRLGDSFTDLGFQICRNQATPGPLHVQSELLGERTLFHPGDTLKIVTRWTSPTGLKLTIEPDLSALVPSFVPSQAVTTEIEPGAYRIVFKLPGRDNLARDGPGIPAVIVARDELCSVSRFDGIRIDLDKTAPATVPIFDDLPAESGSRVLRVTGTSQDASWVALLRNDVFQFRTPVEPGTFRFEADLDLVNGVNKINAWAEDEVGNKTPLGQSHHVSYVGDRATRYPTPFVPGDAFVVHDSGGMTEARLAVFNLQGDRVIDFRKDGSFLEAKFAWDGRDVDGDLAQPGYYLIRVQRRAADGKTSTEVNSMLFRND